MKDIHFQIGFICAGVANIVGALGSSMAFTNPHLVAVDPEVISNFGLAVVILWGCAYLATASHWRSMKWLVFVFCIEKVLYGVHWISWIRANGHTLGALFEQDFGTGLFFSVYGVNDILFAIFFAVAYQQASAPPPPGEP
jgi:hypothetical protein